MNTGLYRYDLAQVIFNNTRGAIVSNISNVKDECSFVLIDGDCPFFRKRIDILKSDPDTNSLEKLPPVLRENLDKNLCTCNEVTKIDIVNAIVNGATTVEAVKKQTYATMGAGCCTQQVERLIECLCAPEPVKRRGRKKMSG